MIVRLCVLFWLVAAVATNLPGDDEMPFRTHAGDGRATDRLNVGYVMAVNKHRVPCPKCGDVHDYLSRDCVPIAFPDEFAPCGYPVETARPPARQFPDIEAQALRYRVELAVRERPVYPPGRKVWRAVWA